MRWQMPLRICSPVDWWHFQLKLFMGWERMRVTQMQLREYILLKDDLQITH
jgi:hypothetical protein